MTLIDIRKLRQNDIRKLRQKSILDQYSEGGILPHPPDTGTSQDEDLQYDRSTESKEPTLSMRDRWKQINEIYTPDTTSRDRFNRLIDSFPQREEPSFGRKLVASGMGWDARKRAGVPGREFTATADPLPTMESVMYAPHMRDITDWKDQAEQQAKAAQYENTANTNERALAGNLVNAQTQADRIASQERIAAERARISEIRAKAALLKANNWNIKILGDRVVGFDPNRPGIPIDLGSSGGMDMMDKIILEGQWDVKAAEARGEAERKNIQARAESTGAGNVVIGGKTYRPDASGVYKPVEGLPEGTPQKIGVPRAATPAKPETKAQYEMARQERMREVATNPDHSKFFTYNATTGMYEMGSEPKSKGHFYNTTDTMKAQQGVIDHWKAVRQYIDTGEWPGQTPSSPAIPPASTQSSNPNKTVVKKEYNPARNQTRITYTDGSIQVMQGRQ